MEPQLLYISRVMSTFIELLSKSANAPIGGLVIDACAHIFMTANIGFTNSVPLCLRFGLAEERFLPGLTGDDRFLPGLIGDDGTELRLNKFGGFRSTANEHASTARMKKFSYLNLLLSHYNF